MKESKGTDIVMVETKKCTILKHDATPQVPSRERHFLLHIIPYLRAPLVIVFFFSALTSLKLLVYTIVMQIEMIFQILGGWCMFLGFVLISRKSKKQVQVSKSSTKSEYCAMLIACLEIIWPCGLLAELGLSHHDAMPL